MPLGGLGGGAGLGGLPALATGFKGKLIALGHKIGASKLGQWVENHPRGVVTILITEAMAAAGLAIAAHNNNQDTPSPYTPIVRTGNGPAGNDTPAVFPQYSLPQNFVNQTNLLENSTRGLIANLSAYETQQEAAVKAAEAQLKNYVNTTRIGLESFIRDADTLNTHLEQNISAAEKILNNTGNLSLNDYRTLIALNNNIAKLQNKAAAQGDLEAGYLQAKNVYQHQVDTLEKQIGQIDGNGSVLENASSPYNNLYNSLNNSCNDIMEFHVNNGSNTSYDRSHAVDLMEKLNKTMIELKKAHVNAGKQANQTVNYNTSIPDIDKTKAERGDLVDRASTASVSIGNVNSYEHKMSFEEFINVYNNSLGSNKDKFVSSVQIDQFIDHNTTNGEFNRTAGVTFIVDLAKGTATTIIPQTNGRDARITHNIADLPDVYKAFGVLVD